MSDERRNAPASAEAFVRMAMETLARTSDRPPPPRCACGDERCDGAWIVTEVGPYLPCPLRGVGEGTDLDRYAREWDELEVEHHAWRFVREVCRAPVELLLAPGLSLVLAGPRGTGKTQAAMMLVRAVAAAGRSARFVAWPAWWSAAKSGFNDERQRDLVAELARPSLLVLDEVGSALDERSSYAWALLEAAVGERYDRGRATVVTTNLTPQRLAIASAGYVGERAAEVEARIRAGELTVEALGSRAFSRLRHAAEWLTFDGPNYRAREDAARRDAAVAAIRRRLQQRAS